MSESYSTQTGARPKRPLYLSIALVLVWIVALAGATEGWQTVDLLRHPDAVRALYSERPAPEPRVQDATIDALLTYRHTVAPLAVGELLLGSLLATMAGLTLLGRTQAFAWLLQSSAAYALLLPIDYALRRPIRAAAIDALATDPAMAPATELTSDALRILFWWMSRGALFGKLAILALGVLAVTRPRARRFFATSGTQGAQSERP